MAGRLICCVRVEGGQDEVKDIVVDTNVFLASLVQRDEFHGDAEAFIEAMDSKEIRAHVSRIVPVEVCGAVGRRTGQREASEARDVLGTWIKEGKIKVYDLTEKRMKDAQEIAIRARIRGMDAIAIQLAYELGVPFKTYDKEIKGKIRDIDFV